MYSDLGRLARTMASTGADEALSEIFGVVFVVIIIALSFINSALKKARRNQQGGGTSARPAQPAKPAQPARPAQPVSPAHAAATAGMAHAAQHAASQPMAPRVQTTVEVSRHDHAGMFEGSLNADGMEGADPCHDDRPFARMPSHYSDRIVNGEEHEMHETHEAEAPAMGLDWTDSDGLVKAFVMQEILKRPCERQR